MSFYVDPERDKAAYEDGRESTGAESFVARYPTAGAILEMVTSPGYRAAVKQRDAAVFDSRLVRMAQLSEGDGFAGSPARYLAL